MLHNYICGKYITILVLHEIRVAQEKAVQYKPITYTAQLRSNKMLLLAPV